MANAYSPTAANVLSSLGVNGASIEGGTAKSGYVPILDASGKLDISTLPMDLISARIEVPALDNAIYVDAKAGQSGVPYVPTGSIVAPFASLREAAATGASGFVLVSGSDYAIDSVTMNTEDAVIKLSSTGSSSYGSLAFYGYRPGSCFILENISVGELSFRASCSCRVILTGHCTIRKIKGETADPSDPMSEKYLSEVVIGPSAEVIDIDSSVNYVSYWTTSDRLTNSSSVVGKTVSDATDRLGQRHIRTAVFTADASGIHASGTQDVTAAEEDGYDCHDITESSKSLAAAANATFYKRNDSPKFSNTVVADLAAEVAVSAPEISAESFYVNDVRMTVTDGFLTIG